MIYVHDVGSLQQCEITQLLNSVFRDRRGFHLTVERNQAINLVWI